MHKLKWLTLIIFGTVALLSAPNIAQSQTSSTTPSYIVVTLDSIKADYLNPASVPIKLNLMLAGVAGTGNFLQKITWPTELWQPLSMGEELLGDARESVPFFALPENRMDNELALTLVALDNTKSDKSWLELTAPRLLEELSILTATWLSGNASSEEQTKLLKEHLSPIVEPNVSLLTTHVLKFSKSQSWGVREEAYEIELPLSGTGTAAKVKLTYSIKRLAQTCQPVNAQVKLKKLTVHKHDDNKETGDVYLWARVARGFLPSEELASTTLRLPSEKTFPIKNGETKELNQVLFEGTPGPFLYLELAAWDEDPAPDPDDLLGNFSGLWLPTDLEPRPVTIEPKVLPFSIRHKTSGGEVTFEFELTLGAQPCLATGAPFNVAEKPRALAVGDFNGDGNLDLAIAQEIKDGKIFIFFGDGRGSFRLGALPISGVGDGLNALVAADFNKDGKLDLAVSAGASGKLSVLLGKGDGTFGPPSLISVGTGPAAIAVADFNNDGQLDLAVALRFENKVAVLLGNGAGRFDTPVTTDVGAQPLALVAGNFDVDGKPDLAIATFADQSLQILLGQGDGRFQAKNPVRLAGQPISVASGDFDRDGNLDVATTLIDVGLVAIFAGNGQGGLSGPTLAFTGKEPWDVKALFLDKDGALDLMVSNSASGTVSVLLNDGRGRFGAATNYLIAEKDKRFALEALVQGDFDKDGAPDVAVANLQTGTVTVLLNRSR